MTNADWGADRVRRAIIQRLEDQLRAGITHWKKIAPSAPIAPVGPTVVVESQPSTSARPLPTRTAQAERPSASVKPPANHFGETESPELAKKKASASIVPADCTSNK